MNEIKIATPGLIIEGEQKGWYVLIQDDSENTGGYLILVTPPPKSIGLIGYDNWVENFQALKSYFQEANWKIIWTNEKFVQERNYPFYKKQFLNYLAVILKVESHFCISA